MEIKDIIKPRRIKLGLTLEEVGKAVGVSKTTVQRWESGNISNLRRDKIATLAKILDLDPVSLVGVDAKPSPDIFIAPSGTVPVYGSIPAGVPAFAEQNVEDYILTTVPNPQDYFALRVKGTSMINAGIVDGCKVLCHKQHSAENGQIVVCRVNGDEATLKRFKQQDDIVILLPENPEYEPRIVPASAFASGEAEILGIVKQIIIDL
jgi:repressor LexA